MRSCSGLVVTAHDEYKDGSNRNRLDEDEEDTGTDRGFDRTIDIWSDGFLNYCMIMVDFRTRFSSYLAFSCR